MADLETTPEVRRAGIFDDGYSIDAGGPPKHGSQVFMGQSVPGPVDQVPFSIGSFDQSGSEDSTQLLDVVGSVQHQSQLEMGELVSVSVGGIQESLSLGIQEADYHTEKNDADGKEFIGGIGISHMIVAHTDEDSFGNPDSLDHYGAARDGYYYYAGQKTGTPASLTGFGTTEFGPNRRSWTFNDLDPLAYKTCPAGVPPSITASDTLLLSGSSMSSYTEAMSFASHNRWYVTDPDFTITVDIAGFQKTSGSDFEVVMEARALTPIGATEHNTARVMRVSRAASENWRRDVIIGTSPSQVVETSGGGTASGKLRIQRLDSGATLRFFYNAGGGFVQIGSDLPTSGGIEDDPVFVRIHIEGNGSASGSVSLSNFSISGQTSSMAGWAREASGTDRGIREDMPETMVVSCSKDSLDLIDAINDKLWMRFLVGTDRSLTSLSRPKQVSWINGILFIANGASDGSNEGGAIFIDFTLDRLRIHREAVSSITGAWFWATESAEGQISKRNDSLGWQGDDNDWAVAAYHCNWTSMLEKDGYLYRAIANQGGMSVFRERRWHEMDSPNVENSDSSLASEVRFCDFQEIGDGYLFYIDNDYLRAARQTVWEAPMDGGVFGHELSKALPGSRLRVSQYMMVQDDGYAIFMPANEGIYRLGWPPEGLFKLYYGEVGSGAVYEILPDHMAVTTLSLAYDGYEELLIAGLISHLNQFEGSRIAVVKLSDNTLYGVSPISAFSMSAPEAIGGM